MTAKKPEVVLSCRHLWKVYGANPAQFFSGRAGGRAGGRDGRVDDPAGLLARIRAADHIPAAADVSFDLHRGEIFVIMGLSGSGKSTVVRCLSRLVEPTAGEVLLEGRDLLALGGRELIELRRHKMGMVFQAFGLMPHLDVIDNVAFPLKLQGMAPAARLERAQKMIDLVGLAGREHAFPDELSGGQQQRVGIARSLAVEPDVWFLDEPFSALDPLIRRQMQDEFLRIQQTLHKSIVFITHDFLEALRVADRIMIMRDGQVVQIGAPVDLIQNPADDYVREFIQDVPWARVLRAGDVAEPVRPGADLPAGLPRTGADVTLEDLLPWLARHPEGLLVETGDGTVAGHITAQVVVRALAAGQEPAPVVQPAVQEAQG